jgi:hypothetical protein
MAGSLLRHHDPLRLGVLMAGRFKAHFWQYGTEVWENFDSADQARIFLEYGSTEGFLKSVGVVYPDGTEREYDYVNDRLLDEEPHGDDASLGR